MTDKQQPEALRLADDFDAEFAQWRISNHTGRKAATELRRQHARIAELEAQLASIGAGGVSGPLMGIAALSANAGEPVAWQYRSLPDVGGVWFECSKERAEQRAAHPDRWEVRPLYAAPPTAQAEGWRSMETAPKDKSNIVLLRQPCGSIANGFWLAEAYAGNGAWIWPYVHKTPTHWMPLPPPPTSAEGVEHG